MPAKEDNLEVRQARIIAELQNRVSATGLAGFLVGLIFGFLLGQLQ